MVLRRAFPEGFVEPCIPTLAAKPPSGPGWVHEIKHDRYRLIVRRDGDSVCARIEAVPDHFFFRQCSYLITIGRRPSDTLSAPTRRRAE
jgi:hypothetical protein